MRRPPRALVSRRLRHARFLAAQRTSSGSIASSGGSLVCKDSHPTRWMKSSHSLMSAYERIARQWLQSRTERAQENPMLNNPWFQLVASLISMIMIANLQYAWTLFVQPMRAEHGWA